MSLSSILSSISNVQREIEYAQRKLTDKSRDEAQKTSRIASVQRSISKETSPSSLDSKLREIERLQGDIARIQNDKAEATRKISDKTEQLHKLQQDLYKEQAKEHDNALKKLERLQIETARRQRDDFELLMMARVPHASSAGSSVSAATPASHDVFICHATEDKDDVVRPLAEALRSAGFDVWYDEFQLRVGDSLRRSIDKGLANSRFGIVVLSPSFFAKNWPQYELDGLVQREMEGSKVILPIWHKISKAEVISYSPSLADKVALNTAQFTIAELASNLAEVLRG
jgi:hypothetical protein